MCFLLTNDVTQNQDNKFRESSIVTILSNVKSFDKITNQEIDEAERENAFDSLKILTIIVTHEIDEISVSFIT